MLRPGDIPTELSQAAPNECVLTAGHANLPVTVLNQHGSLLKIDLAVAI